MARENPSWGEERIANELSLKLGLFVDPRTIGDRDRLASDPALQCDGSSDCRVDPTAVPRIPARRHRVAKTPVLGSLHHEISPGEGGRVARREYLQTTALEDVGILSVMPFRGWHFRRDDKMATSSTK
jgi:hypothetical protein